MTSEATTETTTETKIAPAPPMEGAELLNRAPVTPGDIDHWTMTQYGREVRLIRSRAGRYYWAVTVTPARITDGDPQEIIYMVTDAEAVVKFLNPEDENRPTLITAYPTDDDGRVYLTDADSNHWRLPNEGLPERYRPLPDEELCGFLPVELGGPKDLVGRPEADEGIEETCNPPEN